MKMLKKIKTDMWISVVMMFLIGVLFVAIMKRHEDALRGVFEQHKLERKHFEVCM